MPATKTSITVESANWQQLKNRKNRSAVINSALAMYFAREPYLQAAEDDFWRGVDASLRTGDGEFVQLTAAGEPLTDAQLDAKLWN